MRTYTDSSGRNIKINQKITCTTKYVIYIIECNCGMRYVGSTVCMLKKRMLEHIRAFKNRDLSYATAKHLLTCQQGDWRKMQFFGIQAIPQSERGGNRTKKLRQMESRLIIQLKTKMPRGINLDEELFVHLD